MNLCEWIGHGEGCNQSAKEGQSYCEQHLKIIYQQGSALSPRRKDQRRADSKRSIESLMNEVIVELEEEGVI